MSSRKRAPRSPRNFLLEVGVSIVFLILMISVVLPWAAQSLANGFTHVIEQAP